MSLLGVRVDETRSVPLLRPISPTCRTWCKSGWKGTKSKVKRSPLWILQVERLETYSIVALGLARKTLFCGQSFVR